MRNYQVLDVRSEYATGIEAREEVLDKLLSLPNAVVRLAKHRLYKDDTYWPEPIDEIEVSISSSPENSISIIMDDEIGMACLGSFDFVSDTMRFLMDSYGVPAFYSEVRLFGGCVAPYQQLNMFFPALAIDAMDREKSIYMEDDNRSENLRICRIEKLILDKNKMSESTPPLFVLGGVNKTIHLVREDLASDLQRASIPGLLIKDIDKAQWLY